MPRKLPWVIAISKPSTSSRNSPPSKRQRISIPTTHSSVQVKPTPKSTAATDSDGDSCRDVNLSIPVYMLPSDEHYIMVEDEFLSIAQTYTRSLHRAEYERLQRLAKTRHARRITKIQRPVVGVQRMSKAAVLKKDGSDSEEDIVVHSVWGKSSLEQLMCRPKDEERDLSVGWRVRSRVRPVEKEAMVVKKESFVERSEVKSEPAGGLQSVKKPGPPVRGSYASTASEESSGDDDDDLDAPIVPKNRSPAHVLQAHDQSQAPSSPLPAILSFPSTLTPNSSSLSSMPSFSQPQPSQSTLYNPPSYIKKEIPDFDFDLEAVSNRSAAYRGRTIARRQAESLARRR